MTRKVQLPHFNRKDVGYKLCTWKIPGTNISNVHLKLIQLITASMLHTKFHWHVQNSSRIEDEIIFLRWPPYELQIKTNSSNFFYLYLVAMMLHTLFHQNRSSGFRGDARVQMLCMFRGDGAGSEVMARVQSMARVQWRRCSSEVMSQVQRWCAGSEAMARVHRWCAGSEVMRGFNGEAIWSNCEHTDKVDLVLTPFKTCRGNVP